MPFRLPAFCIGPRAERNLALALAFSVLLHGFALWLERGAPAAAGNAAPLRATLQKAPSAPAPASELAGAAVSAPVAVPSPLPEPLERTYQTPPPASPAPETAALPDPVADPMSEEAPLLQPPRPAIDLDGLRQYHAALSRVAAHFYRYPGEAREGGWEGRVVMRLHISAAGVPIGLSLIDDTGFPVLDQAALDMMRLAAGHTPVPVSLHGRAFTIDLAADYKLDGQDR